MRKRKRNNTKSKQASNIDFTYWSRPDLLSLLSECPIQATYDYAIERRRALFHSLPTEIWHAMTAYCSVKDFLALYQCGPQIAQMIHGTPELRVDLNSRAMELGDKVRIRYLDIYTYPYECERGRKRLWREYEAVFRNVDPDMESLSIHVPFYLLPLPIHVQPLHLLLSETAYTLRSIKEAYLDLNNIGTSRLIFLHLKGFDPFAEQEKWTGFVCDTLETLVIENWQYQEFDIEEMFNKIKLHCFKNLRKLEMKDIFLKVQFTVEHGKQRIIHLSKF